MAAVHSNGANGVNGTSLFPPARFSEVPSAITVAMTEPDGTIVDIESALDDSIPDDPTEICTLLENERQPKRLWMDVAIAYAKHRKVDVAIEVLTTANTAFARGRSEEKLSILNGLCWLYLLKCRGAPRVKPDGQSEDEVRTKDFYIQQATGVLNEASRISPSYPPLFLARGVLQLLRASLQPPSTSSGPNSVSTERLETLKSAAKCFDDALRASHGKNLMAKLGKARALYSMGKYADALKLYQAVLEGSPDLIDPDPRIGIGCCFWQLGFKDEAFGAWERSHNLNPKNKVPLILLGLYKLHQTSHMPATNPKFGPLTTQAFTQYVVPSLQRDKNYPLTCATLSGYFYVKKQMDKVETLSRRAIELTDVNDIASDGWYQLARKEHYELEELSDELSNQELSERRQKAMDYYQRSDRARGGDERGYIPAKLGAAQVRVLGQDYSGAKFRLEKILAQQPTLEAQILLGTLYAEDVFAAQAANAKENPEDLKKALKYLEDVTKAWKDTKRNLVPDQSVLLNLARLYEADHPDKSLKCLEEVEKIELNIRSQDPDTPEDIQDLRELLPPQLLNNMGCFHYQSERYVQARELFQTALNACVKAAARDETSDTDALVTSISFNLGRTYECEGMIAQAKDVYEHLLERHAEYIDARIRLAYISLQQSPTDQGPKAVAKLFDDHPESLEVRALFGWYTNKSKKRTLHIAEDKEQKHWKHILVKPQWKHDLYALTGMGNIYLTAAREMRGTSETEKAKRWEAYNKAAEFFDKVISLDARNAYAAQGIGIVLAEEKKDYATALQIFTKVKETLKDYNVYMNLGHTYCELKQYTRAIENYDHALSKAKPTDTTILTCLGRVWLLRGKAERSLPAMQQSLSYSQRALDCAPTQVHFQFNVAFVQMQIAQLVLNLKETERTLSDVEAAAAGLDAAIESFMAIAKAPQPPFPANDIEQRASMGRNTMRKQLERAKEIQGKYEQTNASKLEQARALREAEIKRREEEARKASEELAERKRRIAEENRKLQERDREYMEKRMEEAARRADIVDDTETGKKERRKKGGKRKKKGGDLDDSDVSAAGSGSESDGGKRARRRRTSASGTEGLSDVEEKPREKKKRKLTQKKKEPANKYKSSELVVDSDEDLEDEIPVEKADTPPVGGDESADDADDGAVAAPRRKAGRAVVDDDDEDEDADADADADAGGEAAASAPAADVVMDEDDEE